MAKFLFSALSVAFSLTLIGFIAVSAQAQDFLYDFQTQNQSLEGLEGIVPEEEKEPFVNQYSDRYKTQGSAIEIHRGLIPQAEYLTRFVRTASAAANQAVLRLSSPVMVNGCVNVEQPQVAIQQNGRMMMVMIGDIGMTLNRSARYAHFECDQSAQVATVDIPLDRDRLLQDRVLSILFQAGPFTDYYDIEVSAEALTLKPRTTNAFKPFFRPGATEPLSFRFLPDTTVVLEAMNTGPAAAGEAAKINALAMSKGLSALSAQPSGGTPGKYYFIDSGRRYVDNIKFGESSFFGTIQLPETTKGTQGEFSQNRAVEIYIKRPGELD